MNTDYELGRLAEELILKRYEDKINFYENKIGDLISSNHEEVLELKKKLTQMESGKYYLRREHLYKPYGGSNVIDTYMAVDDVTKKLEETKIELRLLKLKTWDFDSLPWYKKIFFKFETKLD